MGSIVRVYLLALVAVFWLAGCGVPEKTGPACSGVVCTETVEGHQRSIVDATDENKWIFFSFSMQKQVSSADKWDLAFRRNVIKSNGGVSGRGGVAIAILKETSFSDVMDIPEGPFIQDAKGKDNEEDGFALMVDGGWYDYDLGTHLLSPKLRVYIVRATDGKHYKMQMHSYYSDDKTSGFPSFNWRRLEGE